MEIIPLRGMSEPDRRAVVEWVERLGLDPQDVRRTSARLDYDARTVSFETFLKTPTGERARDDSGMFIHTIASVPLTAEPPLIGAAA